MDSYGAPVRDNQPLRFLYVLGLVALAVGALTLLIAAISGNQPGPYGQGPAAGAVIGMVAGSGLIALGLLAVIAGATAHAINWQIVNRSTPTQQERPDLAQRLEERRQEEN